MMKGLGVSTEEIETLSSLSGSTFSFRNLRNVLCEEWRNSMTSAWPGIQSSCQMYFFHKYYYLSNFALPLILIKWQQKIKFLALDVIKSLN